MNKKTGIFKALVVVAIILNVCLGNVAFCHGGKTDGSGGHKDKNNVSGLGPYHYHCGGNPPHLHEGGVCPYSSSALAPTSTPAPTPTPTPTSTQKQTPEPTPRTTTPSTSPKPTTQTAPKVINAESVKIDDSDLELLIGTTHTLNATITPSNTTDKTLTWESSNSKIVTVNSEGNIETKSVGEATITVTTSNGKTSEVNIIVKPIKVEEIKMNTENIEKEEVVETSSEPVVETDNILEETSSSQDVIKTKNYSVITSLIAFIGLIIYGIKTRNKDKFMIKSFIGNAISWFFVIFTLMYAMIAQSLGTLIIAVLAIFSIAPPICKLINAKFENKYTVKVRIIVYLVLLIVVITTL